MVKELVLPFGTLKLPAFFPDATLGVVRCLDAEDALAARCPGLEMNTWHLYNRPGAKLVKAAGGLRSFTGWQGAILTDSGGFQLYSQIRENPDYGEIREKEILFRPDLKGEKVHYTPEKCIQAQFNYSSDIMMALDLCTHPSDPIEAQERSVYLTVKWGARCREEYDRLVKNVKGPRPLLFGIVQGGADRELRMKCGEELEKIGFDGYGFGGWPTDENGKLYKEVLQMAADAMPDSKVKYAMGVGRPEEIAFLYRMGYSLFDCVIPSREARHMRLYAFLPGQDTAEGVTREDGKFYRFVYIMDEAHTRDFSPIDLTCDCPVCRKYSKAFLQHLFRVGDSAAMRLATIHNLRFYSRLMEKLGEAL